MQTKYRLTINDEDGLKYQCGGCGKIYKTESGCDAHLKKCDSFPESDDTSFIPTPFIPTVTDLDKKVEEICNVLDIHGKDIDELKEIVQTLTELNQSVEKIKSQLKVLNLWRD